MPLKEWVTQDTSHMASEQLKKKEEGKKSRHSYTLREKMGRAAPTAEQDSKQLLQIRNISLPFPKITPCITSQPFRRKAGLYLTHLPPRDRTNHSSLHSWKQTSSPASPKSKTKTKKSLLWQTFWRIYHLQAKHCSPVLTPPWAMATNYTVTFPRKSSLLNKDGCPQDRYPIFLSAPWSHLL